jgi:hypothetical protein
MDTDKISITTNNGSDEPARMDRERLGATVAAIPRATG